jgi:hypothetical protein
LFATGFKRLTEGGHKAFDDGELFDEGRLFDEGFFD